MDFFSDQLQLKVVSSPEELQQAFAMRTLVYIGEQNCPWAEEFDGNDFAATHVLGLIDDEPVATARMRWFGGFAKLERLALRSEHRGNGHGRQLLSYLLKLCSRKGFTRIYLHAQARLQAFYEGYGFVRLGNPFHFSEHTYVEMLATLPSQGDVLDIDKGPHVLNRPEGCWHVSGILERSAQRVDAAISVGAAGSRFHAAYR